MAKRNMTTKRLAIDKANASVILAISLAIFVVIFTFVAGKAMLDQRSYQSKVIGKKKVALKQLKKNVQEVEKLNKSYQAFASETTNILGGNPKGTAGKDGSNPRIVLDALPSKYDFPALTTSLEKLLKDNQYAIDSISGTDDEVAQGKQTSSVSPTPVAIPFTLTVSTSASAAKPLLQLFERSIRPIQVKKLVIAGSNNQQLKVTVDAKTYYQPEKKFDVKVETIKRNGELKSTTKKSTGSTKK